MIDKFLNKYFHVHKINSIRMKVLEFAQMDKEQFFEA